MSTPPATTAFSRLPLWIQSKIKELDVQEPEKWVMRPIPALKERSVLEVADLADGEALLREFFSKATGR